jgi:hypothetical protein
MGRAPLRLRRAAERIRRDTLPAPTAALVHSCGRCANTQSVSSRGHSSRACSQSSLTHWHRRCANEDRRSPRGQGCPASATSRCANGERRSACPEGASTKRESRCAHGERRRDQKERGLSPQAATLYPFPGPPYTDAARLALYEGALWPIAETLSLIFGPIHSCRGPPCPKAERPHANTAMLYPVLTTPRQSRGRAVRVQRRRDDSHCCHPDAEAETPKKPLIARVRVFARAPSVTSLPDDDEGLYPPAPCTIHIDAPRGGVG